MAAPALGCASGSFDVRSSVDPACPDGFLAARLGLSGVPGCASNDMGDASADVLPAARMGGLVVLYHLVNCVL